MRPFWAGQPEYKDAEARECLVCLRSSMEEERKLGTEEGRWRAGGYEIR